MPDNSKTRFGQIKDLKIIDMSAFLSWYFGCDRCPAKKDNCYDNDAMCMDAICEWLRQKGNL